MEESLYYAQIKLLMTYCQTCLDKKMKEKLMMFLFKKTLFDNALLLGFTDDAEQYYNEMLLLLEMKGCSNEIICKKCEYGKCTIC